MRVPHSMRENRSRPNSSVPNQCLALGWDYVEVAQTGEAGFVKADFVTTNGPVRGIEKQAENDEKGKYRRLLPFEFPQKVVEAGKSDLFVFFVHLFPSPQLSWISGFRIAYRISTTKLITMKCSEKIRISDWMHG